MKSRNPKGKNPVVIKYTEEMIIEEAIKPVNAVYSCCNINKLKHVVNI